MVPVTPVGTMALVAAAVLAVAAGPAVGVRLGVLAVLVGRELVGGGRCSSPP